MKIELLYDPIRPETIVRINDAQVDTTDIFGFLYPVRTRLLQSWLAPSGSWPGLYKQICDLARGERVELHFYGRATDFSDVEQELGSAQDITLHFSELDTVPACEAALRSLGTLTDGLLHQTVLMERDEAEISMSCKKLFPELTQHIQSLLAEPADTLWLRDIRDEAQYAEALAGEYQCCRVYESYLTDFDRIDRVCRLTSSLRRSPDMLCCIFRSKERLEEFREYAGQFTALPLCFALEQDTSWQNGLEEKYGQPYCLRARLTVLYKVRSLFEKQFCQLPELEQALRELHHGEHRRAEEIRREKTLTFQKRWITHQHADFERFCELLEKSYLIGGDAV